MTLLGLITAALVVTPLVRFEQYAADIYGVIRPHALLFFLVLPVPAILLSFADRCGYYFGARITNYRPGKLVLLNLCLFSSLLLLAIHWLEHVFVFSEHAIVPADMGFGGVPLPRPVPQGNGDIHQKWPRRASGRCRLAECGADLTAHRRFRGGWVWRLRSHPLTPLLPKMSALHEDPD